MMIIETCPKCGGDLHSIVMTTLPPISAKRCNKCGWYWEGNPEEIKRIPFTEHSEGMVHDELIGKLHEFMQDGNPCYTCPFKVAKPRGDDAVMMVVCGAGDCIIRQAIDALSEHTYGRWVKRVGENGVTSACVCSECGFEDNRYELFDFCPKCGASMVGGDF